MELVSSSAIGGIIDYEIRCLDATDAQVIEGSVKFTASRKSSTITVDVNSPDESLSATSGTITTTWNAVGNTSGSGTLYVTLNVNTSLTGIPHWTMWYSVKSYEAITEYKPSSCN